MKKFTGLLFHVWPLQNYTKNKEKVINVHQLYKKDGSENLSLTISCWHYINLQLIIHLLPLHKTKAVLHQKTAPEAVLHQKTAHKK